MYSATGDTTPTAAPNNATPARAEAGAGAPPPAPANPNIEAPNPILESGNNTLAGAAAAAQPPLLPPLPLLRTSIVRSDSWERNQAPGILDRRKTVKQQPDRSRSRSSKGGVVARRGGPPIRVTMAEDDGHVQEETFEDAVDITPKTGTSTINSADKQQHVDGDTTEAAINRGADGLQSHVQTNGDRVPAHSRQATLETAPHLVPSKPGLPERERSISPTKQVHGLSGDFAVTNPPPPSTADRVKALEQRPSRERTTGLAPPRTQAEGLARKASSGFAGLLGRMGSIRKTARSPPAPKQENRFAPAERRNTGASLADGASGLASIADEAESAMAGQARPSLKDQFRDLRRQEELAANGINGHAAVNGDEDDMEKTPIARTKSDAGVLDSGAEGEEQPSPTRLDRSASIPGLLKSPSLDQNLPPGTASGISAGPADEPRPVNWDLWEHVVNEGPAAVKRTSGAELQAAVASGIPAAIRGVVWQVLAESKSEELEAVYQALKARGTEAETALERKPAPMSRSESHNALGITNGNGNGNGAENQSISSSRSSVHSEMSTPATSAMASPPPSSLDAKNPLDVQGRLLAEKQKRQEQVALAKLEKAIKRDMGARTSFSKYSSAAGLQDALFGVCKAYALFDDSVGYAQGINFIAMPLLFNMSEAEAFTLLVKMMGSSKYDLRSMFTPDMAGLHLRLYQFERLLEDAEPALYCHLRRRKVEPGLYATQWFLTLFAYRFPLQLVLRVYDLVLSEGLTTAILRFGIVLMRRNREVLLGMHEMSALCGFLKEKLFDVYIDSAPSASSLLDSGFFGSVSGSGGGAMDKVVYRADEMVREACEIEVSEAQLAEYARELEEAQKVQRERTEEMEALRSANVQLGSRLKALEERSQQQDTEHVALAGELVRGKVELDSVMDENEGLKMKMQELERVVEVQSKEVEDRLREEMERIMGRNVEVQGENRGLREEMEEVERELVECKMVLAQAQADRDNSRRRTAAALAALSGTG
ncbi:hypothetical protein LTR91_001499 [Friedmanniomyces endolithicus]|uniref:GTPase-activating protein GYP5 n=1 Tax=Friedmanniomyces endolithicus TaxID=329885 RepID=A0AAN6R1K6_9PEZI|nr:hypothetical protein LTR35_006982 [Friedmanniomyces endolithicus]KAK0296146.1 hypothetical protein LTS00_005432 [Friedmanniomyces endolithicus]KAK0327880.1 hypothetical protein LTR82_001398 [Friedmanniomyces endolithicus]KAK0923641.1 hypothetical protein LTR57_006574 [Friedmanniomyces endolithicus]KAK0977978.1 hypothetical protein LTS01_012946 [Friedmanniomyces endolithicus]